MHKILIYCIMFFVYSFSFAFPVWLISGVSYALADTEKKTARALFVWRAAGAIMGLSFIIGTLLNYV